MKFFSLSDFKDMTGLEGRGACQIIVLVADGCAPCEIAKRGVVKAAEESPVIFADAWCYFVKPDLQNKRELGKFIQAGYSSFPMIKVIFWQTEILSINGIITSWSDSDVARIITDKVSAAASRVL